MANTKEGTTIEITTGKPIVGKKIFISSNQLMLKR